MEVTTNAFGPRAYDGMEDLIETTPLYMRKRLKALRLCEVRKRPRAA
jgi:hypothetical protein